MKQFFKVFASKNGKAGKAVSERLKRAFPQVQPKRWMGYDGLKKDALMIVQLFFRAINVFKKKPPHAERASESTYESRDDYMRKHKLSPAGLKAQIKRMTIYSFICHGLGLAIIAYTVYVFISVSILDAIICLFFACFVFAKGLQFNLFVKQLKSGNFQLNIKQYFGLE